MRRDRCGSCGSNILQPFLDLGSTPLADAFPKSPDEDETFYPLGLLVCQKCWLVQNTEVVPDDLLYNGDYGFYTGSSPAAVAYFADYAKWAIEHFAPQFVVEIASNDGTLLKHFADAGCAAIGVEPSVNVALSAPGHETVVAPFGRKVAADLAEYGKPDLIIANNVIAHVSDLDDFLGGIADLLAPKGTALIEFQYVADLLLGNQFDHVYHEHRSFFSVSSLDTALRRHGLHVEDWHYAAAQGGSIRAVVMHGTPNRWRVTPETWLEQPETYGGVQFRAQYLRRRLQDLVYDRGALGPVVGYGATAKSTTLLNFCGFDAKAIAYVEDLTPSKVGRFTPGTGIPILSPAQAAIRRSPGGEGQPTYLLLAWNYLPSILDREWAFRRSGGKFIVPIPQPTLL